MRFRLLAASLLALTGCRPAELPPVADRSLGAAIRRAALTPDADSVREAVVRHYLASLPRVGNSVIPAVTELCLAIASERSADAVDELLPPVPPPPGMPPDAQDPPPAFLARFRGEAPAVIAGSSCSESSPFMMELLPIRRWTFADAEVELPAYVAFGPVGYLRTYTATQRSKGWELTSCTTAIGFCDEMHE
jgi:hypothetical protein